MEHASGTLTSLRLCDRGDRGAGSALAPAAVFLAVRSVGLGLLMLMTALHGGRVTEELSSWDGLWLLDLAENGYKGVAGGHADAYGRFSAETPLAFFPGYPLAVATLHWVGLETIAAGLLVSLLGGIAAAYALVRLVELIPGGSWRCGLILVALFAAAPMGVVLSMTYGEALFCAFAAWALVGVLQERWLLAGVCCAAAGSIRSTGFAIVAAVMAAAIGACARDRESRPLLAVLLAPLGILGYLAYVAVQTGSAHGWLAVQERGWGWRFDGGVGTAQWMWDVLMNQGSVFEVGVVAVIIGYVVLFGVAVHRMPWPLVVYGAGVLFIVVGSDGLMFTKARLLVPAFVLFVPMAFGLARRRLSTVLAVLVATALVSAWFGAYALVGRDNAI